MTRSHSSAIRILSLFFVAVGMCWLPRAQADLADEAIAKADQLQSKNKTAEAVEFLRSSRSQTASADEAIKIDRRLAGLLRDYDVQAYMAHVEALLKNPNLASDHQSRYRVALIGQAMASNADDRLLRYQEEFIVAPRDWELAQKMAAYYGKQGNFGSARSVLLLFDDTIARTNPSEYAEVMAKSTRGNFKAMEGCNYPWTGTETQLAYRYPVDATLCINAPTRCPECRNNWIHECRASGRWAAKQDCNSANQIAIRSLKRTLTVNPVYPTAAREQHVEGWVEAALTLSPDGRVEAAEVYRSDPPGVFDEAALTALRQWTFEPTGRSTSVQSLIRLRFEQDDSAQPPVAVAAASSQVVSRPIPSRPPDLSGQIASAQAAVERAKDKVSQCRNSSVYVDQACNAPMRDPAIGAAGCAIQRTLYSSMGCDPASIEADQREARTNLSDLQNRQRQQQQSYEAALRAAAAPPPSPAPVSYSSGTNAGTPRGSISPSAAGCPRDLSYMLPTLSPRLASMPGIAESLRQPIDGMISDRASLEKMMTATMLQRDAYKATEDNGKQCAQQLDADGSLDDSWVDYSKEPQGAREMCFHTMRLGQDGVRMSDALIKALQCRRGQF